MKVGQWVRSSFVVAALSVAACIPARAAITLSLPAAVDQSVAGPLAQAFDYSFTAPQSGLITTILTDLGPVPFNFLGFEINTGATLITPHIHPGTPPPANQLRSFSFSALANTVYSLTVFAAADAIQGNSSPVFFGKYHLAVSDIQVVPEPGIWLMMIGGIGLLGWMRLRKSETFG